MASKIRFKKPRDYASRGPGKDPLVLAAIAKMTNWQRHQWVKAGRPIAESALAEFVEKVHPRKVMAGIALADALIALYVGDAA